MELELRWAKHEEEAFSEIQKVSRLTRIQAIHLWKRCNKNRPRAIKMAVESYPKPTPEQEERWTRLARLRK